MLQLRENLTLPQDSQARAGLAAAEHCHWRIPAQQLELAHEECSKLSRFTAALQGIFKTNED